MKTQIKIFRTSAISGISELENAVNVWIYEKYKELRIDFEVIDVKPMSYGEQLTITVIYVLNAIIID